MPCWQNLQFSRLLVVIHFVCPFHPSQVFRVAFLIRGYNEDPHYGAVPYIHIYLVSAQQRSETVSKPKYAKAAPPRGSGAVLEQVNAVLEAG